MADFSHLSVRMGARRSVIGVDEPTGTLESLYQFFEALPSAPDAAFVLVLPRELEIPQPLSERLARHTDLPVMTVTEPMTMAANRVYLSPPGRQLVFRRNVIEPLGEAEADEHAVPMVYVFRALESRFIGDGTAEHSYRLVVQPAQGAFGTEAVPVALVEPLIETDLSEAADAAVDPRVERLEAELRETRAELRDMVQKYESMQRRLHRANAELQSANDELEERTEQVRSLSEALALAEENERERLSHVLHDDLQQVLFAVRTKLDLLEGKVSGEGREQRLLTRAIEMLDDGIDTTRTLAHDLNPPVEDSLWDTLNWLTIQMQEAYGLSVEMRAQGQDRGTDKALRVLVVRLVQELLFNVVKHAGTDEAWLRVLEGDDRLRIVVADDGTGFDPEEALDDLGDGFGLGSVRKRVELVGGRISVESAPGAGTRVVLAVPYRLEDGEEADRTRRTY